VRIDLRGVLNKRRKNVVEMPNVGRAVLTLAEKSSMSLKSGELRP